MSISESERGGDVKRDMDLIRLILLKVEEEYQSTALMNLKIDGYSASEIAYNCNLAYGAGYLVDCKVNYSGDEIWSFGVGALTWEGHDFLDKIRDDSRWEKMKRAAKDKGLPLVAETVGIISTAVITAVAEGATNSFLKQYGLIS